MVRRNQWIIGLMGLILVVTLTGCWDQRPVESRVAVAAIGIDPSNVPGNQRYTFLFPNPSLTASHLASVSHSQEFYPITVTAPSLMIALRKIQASQSRALYLGQVRIVALSSALPTSVWRQILFNMADSGRFVLTLWVVGTANAQRLVEQILPSNVVPEVALYQALTCHCQALLWPGRGWQVWDMAATPGVSIHVADVVASSQKISIHSLLVVGKTPKPWSQQETTGWAYLTGHVNHNMMTVKVGDEHATVALIRGNSQPSIRRVGDHIVVTDTLRYSGILVAGSAPGNNLPSDTLVERAISRKIQHVTQMAWHMAHVTGTDPMGWHRDAQWVDMRWASPAHDWRGWELNESVHFVLRDEGVLR